MNPEEELDQKLRNGWHSKKSAAEIAQELGLDIGQVNNRWRRLRLEGKLPTRGRRQIGESFGDGRPSVNIFGPDPLADALKKGER